MSLSTADHAAALADLPLSEWNQWNEAMNQAVALRKERERRELEEADSDLPHSEFQILIFTV